MLSFFYYLYSTSCPDNIGFFTDADQRITCLYVIVCRSMGIVFV